MWEYTTQIHFNHFSAYRIMMCDNRLLIAIIDVSQWQVKELIMVNNVAPCYAFHNRIVLLNKLLPKVFLFNQWVMSLLDTWYILYCVYLKLPSMFAAWVFWTFHTKSHNMKALVIHDHHFSHLLVYMEKNELLWVSVQPSGILSWEKSLLGLPMQITWACVGSFSHGLITVRQKKMWT